MAILNVDGIVAGLQAPVEILKVGGTMEAAGVLHSMAYATGMPGAAVAPASGLSGGALTSYSGQIPFSNPVSGNTYLTALEVNATATGHFIIYDRLWHNSGIAVTTTTAQTITSAAWPARDRTGTTDGAGVLIGIEVSTATTNGAAVTNTTMSYTNSAGTSGRTAIITSFPQTAVAGTFVPFQLAAGDVGVRSIQSVTLGTSYGAGAVHLVAYRVLATIPISVANVGVFKDFASLGMPRLYDNTVPFVLWRAVNTTAVTLSGLLNFAQG